MNKISKIKHNFIIQPKPIKLPTVRIFILCYDDYTEKYAHDNYLKYTWAYIVRITKTIKYLESIMYLEWLEENYNLWKDYDYVGTLSWKFVQKIGIPNINNILYNCKTQNIDIYPFYFIKSLPNLNYTINNYSGDKFKHVWITILKKIGYPEEKTMNVNIKQFYSNYWICKSELMLDYCKFCKKVKDEIEKSHELDLYLYADTNYKGGISKQRCLEIFERPYYTMHPFIFEDLPCFYFCEKGFKIG